MNNYQATIISASQNQIKSQPYESTVPDALQLLAQNQTRNNSTLEQEQKLLVDKYADLYKADIQSGKIDQAKLKQLHPELVPSIQNMIMHSSGYNSGTEIANNLIQDINNSADIYDTASRLNRANDVRQNLLSQTINDFFTSGALKSFDAKLQQQESTWANATAQFQEKEQLTALGSELFSDLSSNNSQDLEKTLQKYRELSSLNEKQIQNSYVTALTQHAYSKGDPNLLAEFNKNIITDPEIQAIANKNVESIKNILWTDAVHKKQLEKEQEENRILENKLNIINEKIETGDINPIKYINSPEELDYAIRMKSSDINSSINETTRNFNADQLATQIIMESTQGLITEKEALKLILDSNNIGTEEKARLQKQMKTLLKGADLLNIPFVAQSFSDISAKANVMIDDFEIDSDILPFATADIRPYLRSLFYNTIANDVYQYYKDTDTLPHGRNMRDIVDNVTTRISTNVLDVLKKQSDEALAKRKQNRDYVPEKADLSPDSLILGTRTNPYKPTTQEEVYNVPVGATYEINNKRYRRNDESTASQQNRSRNTTTTTQ